MKTLKLRIKDKHCKVLDQLASEVNFVWNYVNDLSFKHLKRTGDFFSAFDMAKYTKGTSKLCGLHSQTVDAIREEYAGKRKQFRKAKLKWRVSNKKSARHSLGLIPFKKSGINYADGYVQYGKQKFNLWDSYGIGNTALEQAHLLRIVVGAGMCVLLWIALKLRNPPPPKRSGLIWA